MTLVGISYMQVECLRAQRYLESMGVHAEVIDPVWLAPLDIETIVTSARKTRRLCVVDNGWTTCGAGAEIVSSVAERLQGVTGLQVRRMGFAPVTCPPPPPPPRQIWNSFTIPMPALSLPPLTTWPKVAPTAGFPRNTWICRKLNSRGLSKMLERTLASQHNLNWPLMKNNITRADLDTVIAFLQQDDPILTQSSQVQAFEEEWSDWLGVKHSVFVNSGSSANLLTMAALRQVYGPGEVIVPALTWVSDIASVIQCGFKPVFVDINPRTLGMNVDQVLEKVTGRTRGVFLTHVLGFNALDQKLMDELGSRGVPLIEDVCESHGATCGDQKLGTFGLMSNFSFYYAHHMSTIEGGMICTNDPDLYQILRMLRSHGLVREATSEHLRRTYREEHPDLNPEFIFAFPAYNLRSTEINAVIGRSQLKRLDDNNEIRKKNLGLFLDNLDPDRYFTDFEMDGSCNYAFVLILKQPDQILRENVMRVLREHGVEFRRGTSGGGNQPRQPYLKALLGEEEIAKYPEVDHVHFYGFYIGNYPALGREKILELCSILNELPVGAPTLAGQRA